MYNASEALKTIMYGDCRKFHSRILNKNNEYTEDVKSIKIYSDVGNNGCITIGGAYSSYVLISLYGSNFEIQGQEIRIELGLEVEDDIEWIPIGKFIAGKTKKSSDGLVEVTAYDVIQSKMSGAFFSALNYPTDAINVLNEISENTGITIDTSNLSSGVIINQRKIVTEEGIDADGNVIEKDKYENPFDGYTYREALGYIAMLYCKYAVSDRNGSVKFVWFTNSERNITSDYYYNGLETEETVFEIGSISCNTGEESLKSGVGTANIQLENPVMTQDRLDYIYSIVKNLKFVPINISFYGDAFLDFGDIVSVVDTNGMVYNSPIMSISQEFDGGLKTSIQSYGGTEEENTVKGAITSRIDRQYTELFLVKELVGQKANFDYVYALSGEFENLSANYAKFQEVVVKDFDAVNADIKKINSNNITTDNLSANVANLGYLTVENAKLEYATIDNLEALNGKFTELESTNAEFKNLITEDIVSINADIEKINANNITTDNIEAKLADIGTLTVQEADLKYATISNLNALSGDFQKLKSDSAEFESVVTESLKSINADINELETNSLTAEKADLVYAKITDLNATNANISNLTAKAITTDNLSASVAKLGYLTVDKAELEYAKIDTLESDYLKIKDLSAETAKLGYLSADVAEIEYAKIDFSNVGTQVVSSSMIKDGAVTNEKVVNLSANKITSGTIDASKITVTNLNADNLTVGTINGKLIGSGSVDLDKLSEEVATKEYLDSVEENLQKQIDGTIETFTKTEIPTLNNEPASLWTDNTTKNTHIGDICYVVNPTSSTDGYCYRFANLGTEANPSYSWVLIKDSDVTKALQDIVDINGEITGIKQFDNEISSWKTDTEEELSSIKMRTTTLETDMGNKVETSVFSSLKQTVDENTASITSLSNTVSKKADNSTVTTLSNTVNTVKQTADANTASISSLKTEVASKADGEEVETLTSTVNEVKQTADSNTASITSLSNTVSKKADNSTVTTLTEKTSSLEQSFDGFKTEVKSTYTTKEEFEGLEIGGRNLARKTSASNTWQSTSTYGNDTWKGSDGGTNWLPYIEIETDQDYTLSFDYMFENVPDSEKNSIGCGIGAGGGNGYTRDLWNGRASYIKCGGSSSAGKFVYYLEAKEAALLTNNKYFAFRPIRRTGADTLTTPIIITISNFKLEKGNKVTDWTPAPEDLASEADLTSLETRVTQTESSITSQASSITAQGTKISTLEQTASDLTVKLTNTTATANTANSTANSALSTANNAAKTATNYLNFSSSGLCVGDMTASTLGKNVLIDSESVNIRNGTTVLATFAENLIELGKNSKTSVISLCGGNGKITSQLTSDGSSYGKLELSATQELGLDAKRIEFTSKNNDNTAGSSLVMASNEQFLPLTVTELMTRTEGSTSYIRMENSSTWATLALCAQNSVTGQKIEITPDSINLIGVPTLTNNNAIWSETTDGNKIPLLMLDAGDNTNLGYGSYINGIGETRLCGHAVRFYIGTVKTSFKPYYEADLADSISGTWRVNGYITGGGSTVYFTIPLGKPIIGKPTVTVFSYNGLIIRQNEKYLYGSSASSYVQPDSYLVSIEGGNCIIVRAIFNNTTNVTNNDTCSVTADIGIDFA